MRGTWEDSAKNTGKASCSLRELAVGIGAGILSFSEVRTELRGPYCLPQQVFAGWLVRGRGRECWLEETFSHLKTNQPKPGSYLQTKAPNRSDSPLLTSYFLSPNPQEGVWELKEGHRVPEPNDFILSFPLTAF